MAGAPGVVVLSSKVMTYADVILPLPLPGTFTYSLPPAMEGTVEAGSRVIVPFGARKIHTAIVMRLHGDAPTEYQVREVMEVLDPHPILLPAQLRLWQWISDYYLCTMGDVFKAALPSGLKLESESVVRYDPMFDADVHLTPSERLVVESLVQKPEQSLASLQRETRLANVLPAVKSLLEKGALHMREEVRRQYRPRTESCVRLSEDYFDEARLHAMLDALHRSPRQTALLMRYLDMAQAGVALKMQNRDLLVEVTRQQLADGEDNAAAALRALRDRGVLQVYDRVVGRLSTQVMPSHLLMHPLSQAQQRAYDQIHEQWQQHAVCLLHGVTSSGKTEVYIHLIQEALRQGKQVLYLLPEIVLTSQLTDRLRRVFGDEMGVYHSRYSDAERVEVWQKQLSAEPYRIIVGVRSSVFLPFQDLGLVIVDEEHENSFKQQDPAPRYHARNVALVLASQCGAHTLLGTATPSIESYHLAQQGRYGLVTLSTRYQDVLLPEIQVVDTQQEQHRRRMTGPFSTTLLAEVRQALERGEQVILFQNRRGFAPMIECHTCGWTPRCTRCDVSLTYHQRLHRMTCHYCGAAYPVPTQCPSCGQTDLRNRGWGTERIEETLEQLFPQSRIARMDLDTTRTRQAYEQIIDDFQHGRTDILVGTQMVTKGLDFERVSVVGILSADTMLNLPDFRSYERAFQMMAQVAGRAGRRQRRGRVILQTRQVDLPVITQVVHNDYEQMYADQLQERQLFGYPPMCRLIYVYMKHRDERVVEALARDMAQQMCRIFGQRVMGPDTPSVGRVQLLYIRKVVLKVEPQAPMTEVRLRLRQLQQYLLSQDRYHSAQVYYDVDPM